METYKKLKDHLYCIRCKIEPGGFSEERIVTFPCYDSQGRLGIGTIPSHPDHVDEERQLCRADVTRIQEDTATIYMNGEIFRVHLDNLIKNQP